MKAETIRTGGAVESQKIDDLYAKLDTEVQEEEATKSLTAATETCAAESTKAARKSCFRGKIEDKATSTGKSKAELEVQAKGLAATKFADEMVSCLSSAGKTDASTRTESEVATCEDASLVKAAKILGIEKDDITEEELILMRRKLQTQKLPRLAVSVHKKLTH